MHDIPNPTSVTQNFPDISISCSIYTNWLLATSSEWGVIELTSLSQGIEREEKYVNGYVFFPSIRLQIQYLKYSLKRETFQRWM